MNKLVSLSVAVIMVSFGATGCSEAKHSIAYNPKLGWINEVDTHGSHYWVVTNIKVAPDQPIGEIGSDTLDGQIDANVLPYGTQLYTIEGKDESKVISTISRLIGSAEPNVTSAIQKMISSFLDEFLKAKSGAYTEFVMGASKPSNVIEINGAGIPVGG